MKFNELYNKLKKYDVILEHPDTAYFIIVDDNSNEIIDHKFSYEENAWTFIIMGGAMFYCESDFAYHGYLFDIIKKGILQNKDPMPSNVYSIGKISDADKVKYEKIFAPIKYATRSDILIRCPEIIQGRYWHEKGYILVSIWNKLESLTPKNIKLLKDRAKKAKHDPDKIYIDMGKDEPSININDLLKPKQEIETPDFDPSIVHLADPKNKRELLLKQGVKQKTPLDIRDKQRLQAESFKTL